MNMYKKGIEILENNQHEYGAFIASPGFETYEFGWIRDGAFGAYALDLVGRPEPAERFHSWVDGVVERHSGKIDRVIKKKKRANRPN